jgi:glycosyltransferase involved in cell wall biosynthesis
MPKTVCVITSIHADYDIRVYKHCLSVRRLGYRTVLVSPWTPRNIPDGIEHVTIPYSRNVLNRLKNWLRLWSLLRKVKADLYHFHDLDLLPFMTFWHLATGKPVVYDVHENYPDEMLYRYSLPRPLAWMLSRSVYWTERICASIIRNVVFVVDAQRKTAAPRWLNTATIRNFASLDLGRDAKDDLETRPPTVIFSGNAYEENGVMLLLDVAAIMLSRRGYVRFHITDRFRFHHQELRKKVVQRISEPPLASYVSLVPNVASDRIMDNLNLATIGVSFNLRVPSQCKALPTKLFEYMAAGLAIVATDLPNNVAYIRAARCGLLGRPEEPETLADAIGWLLDHPGEMTAMGRRGRKAFLEHFNWEAQDAALEGLYQKAFRRGKADFSRA